MNTAIHPDPTRGLQSEAAATDWTMPTLLVTVTLCALLILFRETVASMIQTWSRSETFTHGFLIAPISIYLVWSRRARLQRVVPRPSWLGLAALAACGLGWLIGDATSILVLQQLCVVGAVVAIVWAMLGAATVRELMFPLAFLFFAVPIGEALVEPMMHVTANLTIGMLRLSGIPVYREGTFFSIPSGDWSVVEGCSGVRYLIASITLGCLYAYLTYRSLLRRTVFVMLSIAVPVVANGVRAWMIVMIAHLSDMRLALGIDHYIYGWAFFGVVMFVMFSIGAFWREDIDVRREERAIAAPKTDGAPVARAAYLRAMLAALLVLAVWPAWAHYSLERVTTQHLALPDRLPNQLGSWRKSDSTISDWGPRYIGPDVLLSAVYENAGQRVGVVVAGYRYSRQGSELVNSQNVMIRQKHPVWNQVANEPRSTGLHAPPEVMEARLRSARQEHLVIWHWLFLDGEEVVNPLIAKMLDAEARLLGRDTRSYGMVIYTEADPTQAAAEARLAEFARESLATLESSLRP